MYDRVGDKIKSVSKFIFIIGAVEAGLGVLLTAILFIGIGGNTEIGALIMLIGLAISVPVVVIAWVVSIFIYGFGTLVDDVEDIKKENKGINKSLNIINNNLEFMEKKNAGRKNQETKKEVETLKTSSEKKETCIDKTDTKEELDNANIKRKEQTGFESELKIFCPSCNTDLSFMNYNEQDLKNAECPFCGKKIKNKMEKRI